MRSSCEACVEHFAKARLENVEREKRVGKKEHAGEGHDGDGSRAVRRFRTSASAWFYLIYAIRAPGASELAQRRLAWDCCASPSET